MIFENFHIIAICEMTISRKMAKIIFVNINQKWQFQLESENFGISRKSAYDKNIIFLKTHFHRFDPI